MAVEWVPAVAVGIQTGENSPNQRRTGSELIPY